MEYDVEDYTTKITNTCTSCVKIISSYAYTYNVQGYIVSEVVSELEAGTRKEPSYEY